MARHWAALGYVLGVIVPVIVRTGRRPVIFSRDTGMGDIICTIPATRELKLRHPGACFIYNCRRDFVAIPQLYGVVDRITSFEHMALIGHWYRFLTAGFYPFSHGDPLVVRTAVKNFCDQFNVPGLAEHPPLNLPEAWKARAKKTLEENRIDPGLFITIHAGPTLPVKEYPRKYWARLVALLREHGFTQIVQLGASHHLTLDKIAFDPVPGVVSLIDKLSLEESMGVISLARLHIGVDSGLLHVAVVVGTPAIGIFGCTLPEFLFTEKYRRPFVVSQVECRGCGHWNAATPYTTNCPNNIRCMQEISPEEVLQACLKKLAA